MYVYIDIYLSMYMYICIIWGHTGTIRGLYHMGFRVYSLGDITLATENQMDKKMDMKCKLGL